MTCGDTGSRDCGDKRHNSKVIADYREEERLSEDISEHEPRTSHGGHYRFVKSRVFGILDHVLKMERNIRKVI